MISSPPPLALNLYLNLNHLPPILQQRFQLIPSLLLEAHSLSFLIKIIPIWKTHYCLSLQTLSMEFWRKSLLLSLIAPTLFPFWKTAVLLTYFLLPQLKKPFSCSVWSWFHQSRTTGPSVNPCPPPPSFHPSRDQ